MTTVYVKRVDGAICYLDRVNQPGMQLEAIDENATEVQTFLNPKKVASLTDYANAVQAHVDATANAREFNDGVTAATYLTSSISRWRADAEALVAWRDQVWAYSYGELDRVRNGLRPQPTIDVFINELPAISWPDV
ncbi:hypothetical protein [Rhizobium sp. WYJ-E13]|uniref:hypothetical protein n=1 Tax=Rhizobium sp. WYJ-E13 TaxID=2849093 RepID=UPI001C1F0715|nr:hypothetical protein [Rhizobium sp. WYJ-E13]QWW67960.1 hypothetical protein KQ933_20640 [Rhizobium sp. WYJ-E13]